MAGQHPGARRAYGGAWSGIRFVFTHDAPSDEGPRQFEFILCGIREAVATASKAADAKKVAVFGSNIAQ
jgi:hypothetical protein